MIAADGRGAQADLRQIAVDLLARMAAEAVPPPVSAALRLATPAGVRDAVAALLAADLTEPAETVYRAVATHPVLARWSAVGLARLAARNADHETAASGWRACFERFAGDAEPWWWTERAQAERACGRTEQAAAALRRCRADFPAFAPAAAALADLLKSSGRATEAVQAWRDVLAQFSAAAQPWWYVALATLLREAGQPADEAAVLGDLVARFPGTQQADVALAQAASRCEDWEQALRLWTGCLDRHAAAARADWCNARALALLRLWRPAEALAAWDAAIARFPDAAVVRAGRAYALAELGEWSCAEQAAAELIAAFPQGRVAEWLALRGRCQLELRQDDGGLGTIAALRAQHPASPLGDLLAFWWALRRRQEEGLLASVEDARRRFPQVRELAARHVWLLLADGRPAAAEQVAAELEAGGADHWTLLSRWRVIQDRDGTAALRAVAEADALSQQWEPDAALAIANYLRAVWSVWSSELVLAILRQTEARRPGRVALRCAVARALIALRRDHEAASLIADLPDACRHHDAIELRAWAAARRGELVEARECWETILAGTYFAAVHAPIRSLEFLTPDRPDPAPPGVICFVAVRDEMANIPQLLGHHRRLGVVRFVVIDHGSRDGSVPYLLAQPDVLLYRTEDDRNATSSGIRWVNELMARHGVGRWSLLVDADEALIYPGWERMTLPGLTAYLDSRGAEAMAGFMLDVFSPRLGSPGGRDADRMACTWYDADYDWLGHARPPYAQPVGGARARLFGAPEYLHKMPLLRCGRARYLDSHGTTPVHLADVTGALLHFKLAALARGSVAADKGYGPPARPTEVVRRYRRYAARIERLRGRDLRAPGVSHDLRDSFDLVDRGLLQASPTYRDWLGGWTAPAAP